MAFNGYLIANVSGAYFPHEYIKLSSYKSTPNQREEIKAYRDDNTRDLVRITAKGKKSTISFTTLERLTLAQKNAILGFFTVYELDSDQRKVKLTYWDDENSVYKEGIFYRPNMEFPIVEIDGNNIYYGELTIELIEY